LGLLILDEPRQQSADKVSFAALLKRVANSSIQQVIFATSEDEETLKIMLKDLPHELKAPPKKMLEPIPKKT
jgi:recombinational DNA repair protein RecR